MSLVLVSSLPVFCAWMSIWVLRCLVIGDSFGGVGGVTSSSSLEDVVGSSEVSDIQDLFDFFGCLVSGSEESDSESVPFFSLPLFLFAFPALFFEVPGVSSFSSVLGVAISVTLGAGFLGAVICYLFCFLGLLLGPVDLLTVAVMASRCF